MGDGVLDDFGYVNSEGPNVLIADQTDATLSTVSFTGDMEGIYVSGVASGWTASGTPTASEETASPYAGSSSQTVSASNTQGAHVYKSFSTTIEQIYKISYYMLTTENSSVLQARITKSDTIGTQTAANFVHGNSIAETTP